MDFLPTLWFVLIAVLWIGYLFLEGFDLGVGMHLLFSARSENDRRVMLNSIGPVWDGNEVWLITAGGATFAAFPDWYASLFSALYLPLTFVLLGLIFRAVGIEFRGKGIAARWARFWDFAIGLGSLVAAFGVGAMLALTTTGLPLDVHGDRVGGPFAWLTPYAVIGGLAVVALSLAHGAVFLSLKTEGDVRTRAGRFATVAIPIAAVPILIWVLTLQFRSGTVASWALAVVAVAGVLFAWISARARREGRSFVGMAVAIATGVGAIFVASYPVVLPSTINHAFDLTISNASSAPYTLGVMSIVASFGIPLVLVYQGWTYWVFRKRVSGTSIPASHPVMAAVRKP
jgi:cytochrome d ubiquinol oxidase subunit II